MTHETDRHSGRRIALNNELQSLYWLHRFGGLLSRQLSALVWPGAAQGLRMAQRTLHRLVVQKDVLRRPLRTGGNIYVLGEAGARRLQDRGIQANTRGTRDLSWAKPFHRVLANDIAIDALNEGNAVWTEFEIQRGAGPFRELFGHIPDVLICQGPENSPALAWIEVENAAKSQARLSRLLALGNTLVSPSAGYQVGAYCITEFAFVIPNPQTFRALVRAYRRHLKEHDVSFNARIRIMAWEVDMTLNLAWGGIKSKYSAIGYLREAKSPLSAS